MSSCPNPESSTIRDMTSFWMPYPISSSLAVGCDSSIRKQPRREGSRCDTLQPAGRQNTKKPTFLSPKYKSLERLSIDLANLLLKSLQVGLAVKRLDLEHDHRPTSRLLLGCLGRLGAHHLELGNSNLVAFGSETLEALSRVLVVVLIVIIVVVAEKVILVIYVEGWREWRPCSKGEGVLP